MFQSNKRQTWDDTFMDFCEVLSNRSTCARLQTAAILVKDYNVISIGYNGCCPKSEHCVDFWENEYNTKYKQQGTWEQFLQSDFFYQEHHKYSTRNELHGESNAIVNAAKNSTSSEGSIMYSLYAPCINCAKLIVSSRIRKVVFRHFYKRDTTGIEFLTEHKILISQI
jgi:dCMP deaminase